MGSRGPTAHTQEDVPAQAPRGRLDSQARQSVQGLVPSTLGQPIRQIHGVGGVPGKKLQREAHGCPSGRIPWRFRVRSRCPKQQALHSVCPCRVRTPNKREMGHVSGRAHWPDSVWTATCSSHRGWPAAVPCKKEKVHLDIWTELEQDQRALKSGQSRWPHTHVTQLPWAPRGPSPCPPPPSQSAQQVSMHDTGPLPPRH